MIFVWIIIALGVFIFLTEVGEGIKNYLSNKREDPKDEPEQPVS